MFNILSFKNYKVSVRYPLKNTDTDPTNINRYFPILRPISIHHCVPEWKNSQHNLNPIEEPLDTRIL